MVQRYANTSRETKARDFFSYALYLLQVTIERAPGVPVAVSHAVLKRHMDVDAGMRTNICVRIAVRLSLTLDI